MQAWSHACMRWCHAACGGMYRRRGGPPLRAVQPLGLGADDLAHPVISIGGSGGAVGAALRRQGARVIQVQNPACRPTALTWSSPTGTTGLRGRTWS
ncbi:hypothetical protein RAA17_17275 [Komagataeibacter rhaeticus]|nr:hypothetical protein [Komagataeibacter rhaeticus]